MNLLLYKFATGLTSLLKGQAEITSMKPMIEGTRGPMAKILETPILGDGKTSRTSGMNSTPQAQAIQKQHSPITHREIGKRASLKLTAPEKALFTATVVPGIVNAVSKGLKEPNDPHSETTAKDLLNVTTVGAVTGGLGGLAHRLMFSSQYGKNKGQLRSVVTPLSLAAGNALIDVGLYGLARTEHPLAHKFLFKDEEKHNG